MAKTVFARFPQRGPIVIPNCAMVAVIYTIAGMTIKNIYHGALTAAGPLNPNIAETIFSAIKASAGVTAWLALMSTELELTGVEVKDLRAPNNPTIPSTGAAIAGSGTGTPISAGSAIVVTLATQFSGRGFFGRSFLCGLTSSLLTDARHATQATGNAAVAHVTAINSAMTASGLPMVVAQRLLLASTNPSAPPPYNSNRPAGTLPVTAIRVTDLRLDSQRRRLG